MYIRDLRNQPVELTPIELPPITDQAMPASGRDLLLSTTTVAAANRAIFDIGRLSKGATHGFELARRRRAARPVGQPPRPATFIDTESALLRTVYREVVVRFTPSSPGPARRALLRKYNLEVTRTNAFVRDQVVVVDRHGQRQGIELVDLSNALHEEGDTVRFATPNFVSQYRRHASVKIPSEQWHLRNAGRRSGQKAGEDVDARGAWEMTRGAPRVVIAVLDDGVDLDHLALKRRLWRNPYGHREYGRDFTLPNAHPDHHNPRPKVFQTPYDDMDRNDIHGTACAGVAVADNPRCSGIAPRCRLLAIRIFQANEMAEDERVADAIRYAGRMASVISLSWSGGRSPDIQAAIEDVGRSRHGRGVAVFAAAGNSARAVEWPAADPNAIGIGASTDQGRIASYSNTGPQISVVAPSGGGVAEIFTTDVSLPGRGFNRGLASLGAADGLFTNDFGGTSSATPLAAGVGGLMLSVNERLSRDDIRLILQETTNKIGPKSSYDLNGHSANFGYGRVNAAQAVAEAAARR